MTESQETCDVFVSYSSIDSPKVDQVVAALRQAGLVVWYDRTSILPGDRLRERINQGINSCAVLLAFVSDRAAKSRWVTFELDASMQREIDENKTLVIPVLLGRINTANLPLGVKGKHYVDLRHNFERKWNEQRAEFIRIVSAIVKGESRSGDLTTLQVGDPLIQFFNSYWFRHRHEPGHRFEQRDIAGVARVLALQFLKLRYQAMENDDEQAPESDSDEDEALAPRAERFIRRYGEYGLQQMFLYFMETRGFSLTGGWHVEEMMELMGTIDTTLVMFDVFFTLETMRGADKEVKILVTFDNRGEYSVRMVGRDRITLNPEDRTATYHPSEAVPGWTFDQFMEACAAEQPEAFPVVQALTESLRERGGLVGMATADVPCAVLGAAGANAVGFWAVALPVTEDAAVLLFDNVVRSGFDAEALAVAVAEIPGAYLDVEELRRVGFEDRRSLPLRLLRDEAARDHLIAGIINSAGEDAFDWARSS